MSLLRSLKSGVGRGGGGADRGETLQHYYCCCGGGGGLCVLYLFPWTRPPGAGCLSIFVLRRSFCFICVFLLHFSPLLLLLSSFFYAGLVSAVDFMRLSLLSCPRSSASVCRSQSLFEIFIAVLVVVVRAREL